MHDRTRKDLSPHSEIQWCSLGSKDSSNFLICPNVTCVEYKNIAESKLGIVDVRHLDLRYIYPNYSFVRLRTADDKHYVAKVLALKDWDTPESISALFPFSTNSTSTKILRHVAQVSQPSIARRSIGGVRHVCTGEESYFLHDLRRLPLHFARSARIQTKISPALLSLRSHPPALRRCQRPQSSPQFGSRPPKHQARDDRVQRRQESLHDRQSCPSISGRRFVHVDALSGWHAFLSGR